MHSNHRKHAVGLLTEGSLGDSLVYIPAIRFLQKTYPESGIHIFGRDPNPRVNIETVFADRFNGVRIINLTSAPASPMANYASLLRLALTIRSSGVGFLFDGCRIGPGRTVSVALRKRRLIAMLAGARTDLNPQPLLAEEAAILNGNRCPKMGLLLLNRMIQAAGAQENPECFSHLFPVSATDRLEAAGWMRANNLQGMQGTYAVGFRSKDPVRAWPVESVRAVLVRLKEVHGLLPVFSGGPADIEIHRDLISSVGGGFLNMGLSFGAEAALISGCRFFFGINSGPMHLAASAGLRCVALFFGDSPTGLWEPLGKGHEIIRNARTVAPDEVFAACDRILSQATAQTML